VSHIFHLILNIKQHTSYIVPVIHKRKLLRFSHCFKSTKMYHSNYVVLLENFIQDLLVSITSFNKM